MKFMVIVPASKESETGVVKPSDAEMFEKMGKFNEELVKAGVMLAGEGLLASSKGSRIKFGASGKTAIVDGPFTESKELIAGFWIIQVKSKAEAEAWMSRAPFGEGTVIEIRQIASPDDFAPADPKGELRAHEEKLRAQIEKQQS
jgi:hypothetical protein